MVFLSFAYIVGYGYPTFLSHIDILSVGGVPHLCILYCNCMGWSTLYFWSCSVMLGLDSTEIFSKCRAADEYDI